MNRVATHLKIQAPALVAIAAVEVLAAWQGSASSLFSIVALVFLLVVVYTALHHGVRQGLISAAIVLAYNTVSLLAMVESLSFGDRNMRRIILLAVVLPAMAYVVGRLKERNDYLLSHEKQARLEAEDSAQRLRFMAESMPQKIFTTAPDGTPEYHNPQWQEYTGMSFEQVRRGDWIEYIHPDDLEENLRLWRHSVKSGEPFSFEHRLRRHDGEYRWHISRAHAMCDEQGRVKLWVGSTTDIHDIKTALQREHQLEKTTARLTEQREQLLALNKAKDEFISLASHQLRTPATGVKQYVGMVLEGFAGEVQPNQQDFLQKAYESNERQITIVNDLLKVASVDAGKVSLRKEKTDIVDLLRCVLDEQGAKFAERKQTVIFEPKVKCLWAHVDAGNLRMVLENVVDNASKYTPEGKNIEVSANRSGGKLLIAVKDEGVGIAPQDREKVFNKFSRIDNPLSIQVGGSGLGLYWAHKIVDLHGGSIDIDSEPGKGSTFTIVLPD